MCHLADIFSRASGTYQLGLPKAPVGREQAQGREAFGSHPPAWGFLNQAPWGAEPQAGCCRHRAGGSRLQARSCWLESGHSERMDLSGGAAVESCTRGQE